MQLYEWILYHKKDNIEPFVVLGKEMYRLKSVFSEYKLERIKYWYYSPEFCAYIIELEN